MQRPQGSLPLPFPPSSDPRKTEEDDNPDDEADRPPPQFFEVAQSMLPGTAGRRLYAAWDKSRGIRGGGDDVLEKRMQAAIGFLFDDRAPSSAHQAQAGPAPRRLVALAPPTPPRGHQPAEHFPAPHPPPFNAPRMLTPLTLDAPVEQRMDAFASGSGVVGVAKKKATAVIDLSDWSEADDLQIQMPAAQELKNDVKGKGRAREVLELSDDEEPSQGDILVAEPLPAPKVEKPKFPAPAAPLALKEEPGTTFEENDAMSIILSIIPDVLPSHVLSLLRQPLYSNKAELVIEELLTNDKYPKLEKGSGSKGKKREREEEDEDKSSGRNYLEVKGRQTLGRVYEAAALTQLYADYPQVSQANVQNVFKAELSSYAPTFVALEAAILKTEAERGWKLMASSRKPDKGKDREVYCLELETEKKWLSNNLKHIKAEKTKAVEAAKKVQEEIASGAFFECGCCYGDSALSTLVMCSNGCQFCTECFTNLVSSQVGLRKFILPCMSVDGCAFSFPEAEAERVLPAITLSALHKIRQEKEVDLADLEGLEKCPFCPFAMVIENENERLFKCQREDCEIASCRQCKKEDHLPKTCAEMDSDRKIDGIHRVEEAMSKALIRRCPNNKCGEPYVKEDGCNKITCPSCRAVSCYICGIIVEGYSHFKNAGSNYTGPAKSASNCELWDDSAKRNFQDVEAARLAAAALVAKENPAVVADDLKGLDLPPPPPPPAHIAHLPPPVVHHHYHHGIPQQHVNVNVNVGRAAPYDYAALAAAQAAQREDAARAAAAQKRMRAAQAALDEQRQKETAARIQAIQKQADRRAREAAKERKDKEAARDARRARLLKK